VVSSADGKQHFTGGGYTVVNAGGTATQVLADGADPTKIVGPPGSGAALELGDNAVFKFSNTKFELTGSATLKGVPKGTLDVPKDFAYLIGKSNGKAIAMEVKGGTLTIADNTIFIVKGTTLTIASDAKVIGVTQDGSIIKMMDDSGTVGQITLGSTVTDNFYKNDGTGQAPQDNATYTWKTNISDSGKDGWQLP
jgi:hypothetical protein